MNAARDADGLVNSHEVFQRHGDYEEEQERDAFDPAEKAKPASARHGTMTFHVGFRTMRAMIPVNERKERSAAPLS